MYLPPQGDELTRFLRDLRRDGYVVLRNELNNEDFLFKPEHKAAFKDMKKKLEKFGAISDHPDEKVRSCT